jgi:hypothetical protein
MLDYILKNKEWMFSGIGVAIILLIINYFSQKKSTKTSKDIESIPSSVKQPEVFEVKQINSKGDDDTDTDKLSRSDNEQETYITKQSYITQEDARRITRELDEMPPLHIDDVTKNYIGFNVDWITEYFSAHKIKDDLIGVRVFIEASGTVRPIVIHFQVYLSEYKQFSILKSGDKIRVTGQIVKFEPYIIELSNVRVFF